MQISDVIQNTRRVRALLDSADIKQILSAAVATEAGVSTSDPGVRVESVEYQKGLMRVEVILEIDK